MLRTSFLEGRLPLDFCQNFKRPPLDFSFIFKFCVFFNELSVFIRIFFSTLALESSKVLLLFPKELTVPTFSLFPIYSSPFWQIGLTSRFFLDNLWMVLEKNARISTAIVKVWWAEPAKKVVMHRNWKNTRILLEVDQ